MSFGGDVHTLYGYVRNEQLHRVTRLKRTNSRNIYLHLHEAYEHSMCIWVHDHSILRLDSWTIMFIQ